MSLSINITVSRFQIFSQKWNEECDNIAFKHHRISAFVTAELFTKEVKLVVVLHDLRLPLQAISVDGLARASLFYFVEILKNNKNRISVTHFQHMFFTLFYLFIIFPYAFYLIFPIFEMPRVFADKTPCFFVSILFSNHDLNSPNSNLEIVDLFCNIY